MSNSTLQARDGTTLAIRTWPCPRGRGVVVLVHGLGEHVGRYEHVAAFLNQQGWSVVGYDHRGHGASQGPRGGLKQQDDLLWDLAGVVDFARREHPQGPLVIVGHSLGGLVAGRFAAAHAEQPAPPWARRIDGVVLSSPALDVAMNPAQKLLMATVSKWLPDVPAPNGLKPEWICRDPQVVKAYVADPLVHDRITGRLARFIVEEGAATRALAARWHLPTLLLYSGPDRCVASRGSDAFAAAAPRAHVEHERYDPLAHEIFNEPERERVLKRLGDWLRVRFDSAAATA
jgi:alpha-beta hydrolase superfamily lysophospholipase